jgi:hypothetical protein
LPKLDSFQLSAFRNVSISAKNCSRGVMLPINNRKLPIGQAEKCYSPSFLGMGYKPPMADTEIKQPIDELRRKIYRRMQEMRIPMKTLSLEMGKNHAYMRQFLFTGSPQRLDEGARAYIADRLGMNEADLGGARVGAPQAVVQEYAIRPGSVTESQIVAALGPLLAVFGIEKGLWPVIARALLKALETAQSLDPSDLQDRDYAVAGQYAARELRQKIQKSK